MTDFNEYKDTDTLRYSNVSFKNNASLPQLAKVTETRTSTLLQKPTDWRLSVIRFDVDSQTLPINIPLMDPIMGGNATQSVITLRYLGVNYSQVVNYIPSSTQPIYDFPSIYNYQDWLFMVNLAAQLAFGSIGIAGNAPQFIYDSNTGLIDLFVDNNYIIAAGVNKITIFMNRQLFSYFQNFKNLYKTINSTDPLLEYEIQITDENSIVQPAVGARQGLPISVQAIVNLYLITDTAPSTATWSSVRSLILSSASLPFRTETVPNQAGQNNYASDNDFPILSDFLVPVETKVTEFRVVNEYLPTAQYRYLDLLSDTPLTKIDLQFYWTDFSGNIYPLFILPQRSFSVKLLFERRDKKKY